jgi:hypothetical protein
MFCDGSERCVPQAPGSSVKVCQSGEPITCDQYYKCDENIGPVCVPDPFDADQDGHGSIETGGDDCDDTNPTIYPGANEVCDTIDQDCNPSNFGGIDRDGDGFHDAACRNDQP